MLHLVFGVPEQPFGRLVRLHDLALEVGLDHTVLSVIQELGEDPRARDEFQNHRDFLENALQALLLLLGECILLRILDVEDPIDAVADEDRHAELGTRSGITREIDILEFRRRDVGDVERFLGLEDATGDAPVDRVMPFIRQEERLPLCFLFHQPKLPALQVGLEDGYVLPAVMQRYLMNDGLGDLRASPA